MPQLTDGCAWCKQPVTDQDQEDSIALGLHDVSLWICEDCIATGRYKEAPESWVGGDWGFSSVEAYWLDAESLKIAIVDRLGSPTLDRRFLLDDVRLNGVPTCVEVQFHWSEEPNRQFGFALNHDWLLADSGFGTGAQAIPSNVWLAVDEETDTGVMKRGQRLEIDGVTWIVAWPFVPPRR